MFLALMRDLIADLPAVYTRLFQKYTAGNELTGLQVLLIHLSPDFVGL